MSNKSITQPDHEFDTSLIDPTLLTPSTSTLQQQESNNNVYHHLHHPDHQELSDIAVNSHAETTQEEEEDEQEQEETLDPLLRNLTTTTTTTTSTTSLPLFSRQVEQELEVEDADKEEEQDDEDDDEDEESDVESNYSLQDTPFDVTEQVEQLREMDQQANESLIRNRQYQQDLKTLMHKFKLASKRTLELKQFVKSLSVELLAGQEMKIFAGSQTLEPQLPWFKHFYGKDLPNNFDGKDRDDYLKQTRFWPWSIAERLKLKQEVISLNHRKIALQAAQDDGEDFETKLLSIDQSWYLEHIPESFKDWETISLVIHRRSAMDCKIQWLQHDHPLLNFKKFSREETKKLFELVEENEKLGIDDQVDWEEIAKKLGNGRVGWDCLKKWRNRTGQRVDWTPEEDQVLKQAVTTHGENWQIIARICQKHSNACINRWSKSVKPSITKGKWSTHEDEALRTAVALVGKNWKLVAPRVRGRTDAQCRERWTNVLDPVLVRKKPWTPQDDQELLEAKEKGMTWAEIARELFEGARTDNKCMRRWQDLQKVKKPKTKSKKGKKKRLPKDTDEEDNGGGGDDEGFRARDDDNDEEESTRPKKRPKRQVKQKNPELSELLAQELDGDQEMGAGVRANGNGALRAGGDIVVDFNMFANEDELGGGVRVDPQVTGDASPVGVEDNVGIEAAKGKGKRKATTRRARK